MTITMGLFLRYELLRMGRDRTATVLLALSLALTLASALDSALRVRDLEANRAEAAKTDREVWLGQGRVNPHSAAHFARYAFRPIPPLAAFDPGVLDFGGSAVWLEAHHQNLPTLRRAESLGWTSPLTAPSPAWVVQVLGTFTLGTFLFGAIARERERGTLALVKSLGASLSHFGLAKLGASLLGVSAFAAVSVLAAVGLSSVTLSAPLPPASVFLLVVAHALAFTAMGLFFLWISAVSTSARRAFQWSGGAWVAMVVLLPMVTARLGAEFYPTPAPEEVQAELAKRAQDAFWKDPKAREAATQAFERQLLAREGAKSLEALGFNRNGVRLQAHEVFANAVYDDVFGRLWEKHRLQDAMMRWMSVASPILSLSRISSSLSGTDLAAQIDFAERAEAHRRFIIEKLNDDMMRNAGEAGFAYLADVALWGQIPDFEPKPRTLGASLADTGVEWGALFVWCLLLPLLVLRSLRRLDFGV